MTLHTNGIMALICTAFVVSNVRAGDCSDLKSTVEAYRELVLRDDVESLIQNMAFPVSYQSGGSVQRMPSDKLLRLRPSRILTEDLKGAISAADTCMLAKIFGVQISGDKIKSLSYLFDKEDLIYSRAGFSSAKKTHEFLDSAYQLVISKNYPELSKRFRYPFFITVDGVKLEIKDQADFLRYQDRIVSPPFVELMERANRLHDFIVDYRGLMLNQKGDYWIVHDDQGFGLKANDPFNY